MGMTVKIRTPLKASDGIFTPISSHEICAEMRKHWHNYQPFESSLHPKH